MKTWLTVRPALFILAAVAGVLLVNWILVRIGAEKMIVPKPEITAEEFIKALGAHRYEGAMEKLSSDLEQATSESDLQSIVEQVEQENGKIDTVKGNLLQEEGDTASASVEVQFENGNQREANLPLVKENGIWRVNGLDGLNSLAQ